MGASFDYMVTTSYDKNDAEDEFSRARDDAKDWEAEGYGGNIGELGGKIVWKDLRVKDERAAADIIERSHQKYSPPLAVSFGTQSSGLPSETEVSRWNKNSGFDKFLSDVMKSKVRSARNQTNPVNFIVDGRGMTFYLSEFYNEPELKKRLIDLHAEFLLFLDDAKRKAGSDKLVWAIGGNCPS